MKRFLTGSIVVIILVQAGVLAGCGRQTFDESMSCSDFMKLSQADRDQAVSTVATKYNNPDVLTPFGRPNVEWVCGQQPNATLRQAVELSRTTGSTENTASKGAATVATGAAQSSASTAMTTPSWSLPDFDLTTSDGYSAHASGMRIEYVTLPTIDVADAKPGKAIVKDGTAAVTAGSLRNTTAGRNFRGPNLYVYGYAKVDSADRCGKNVPLRTSAGSVWCAVGGLGIGDYVESLAPGVMGLDAGTTGGLRSTPSPMGSPLQGEVPEGTASETVASILSTQIVWVVFAFSKDPNTPPYREAKQLPAKDWLVNGSWVKPNGSELAGSWVVATSGDL